MKYRITLELNVYAEGPATAMTKALVHLNGVLGNLAAVPAVLWSRVGVPNAAAFGAPHSPDALNGWGCIVSIDEYERGQ